jgi:Na+/proline symporter
MLQIIGWILCVGLFCFGVSMIGNVNYQVETDDGKKKMSEAGNLAAVIAIFAAFGFAFWLYAQGKPLNDAYNYSSSSYSPLSEAQAEAEADAAAAGAEAAAAAADAAAAGR